MKLISLSTLSSIAVLAAPVAAQGILPYLPEKTMMVASAPDLSMSIAEFQEMPLAKMWAEEEVQTFIADVREMAMGYIDEGLAQAKEMHAQGALPVDPAELMKLRVSGVTLAVTSLDMSMGDFGPMPKFGLVAHLDFGESAETWNNLIQMGLGMLQAEAGDDLEKTEMMVGDIKMMSMRPKDVQGLEMGLNIAMVPGGILLGTLTDDVRGIVENMQSKTATFSTTDTYKSATSRLTTSGAEASLYMSMDPMVDFGMNLLRMAVENERELAMVDIDGVERAMQAMGMRDLGAMAVTMSYEGGKSVTRGFHAHGANAGATASVNTIDTSFLKWVPKDAVSFGAGTMDVASLYDTLLKGLQAYDEKFAEQALAHLAKMEEQLGFSVRNDLFGALGDHYITWSMPMGTISSAPEMAFLMKINDQDKLVGALKNLADLTNGMVEIEEGTKRGLKAYQVQINFDPTDGMGGMNPFDMFQPTFSFKDGYMVVGFSASDVKRVFKRMDRDDDPKGDIRSNKEYVAVADSIPQGVTSVSFTDWKANFESYYQLGTGVLAFVPMPEDVPIDMSLLPDSETLTQHLFAGVSYTKADANGVETVEVSPFGPEAILAVAVVIGAAGAAVGMMADGGF